MNQIGIFGVGAIGSVLAKHCLANSSNTCYFFNRSPLEKIEVRFKDEVFKCAISLTTDASVKLDWLIICIKEYHYKAAIQQIQKSISEKTKIAIFKNGLDLAEQILPYAQRRNILETIIDCPVQRNMEGHYDQINEAKITLPNSSLANEFIQLFEAKSPSFNITNQFLTEQWMKLLASSALGAVQVATLSTSSILQEEQYLNLFKDLVHEAVIVADAEGVELPDNFEQSLIPKVLAYPPEKGSSMLSDKIAGKQLELNAKIGVILKKAKSHNLQLPVTEQIFHKIKDTY